MKKKEQLELQRLITERIKFYADISNENDVKVREFQVLSHPKFKDTYLVRISYIMNYNDQIFDLDEIEVWTKDAGWFNISKQMSKLQQKEFLKDCESTKFDTSAIKIK